MSNSKFYILLFTLSIIAFSLLNIMVMLKAITDYLGILF